MDDLVRGERIVLRRPRVDDAHDVIAACNDDLVRRYMPDLPRPYTLADALWWINEGSPAAFGAGGAAYVVADAGTDRLLGTARVGRPSEDSAEVGYWVAPWARGQGVATAAVRRLAAHAFERGLARLSLRTEAENTASQRVAIAAGFGRESVERGSGRGPGGGRCDLVVWARLAGDPDGPAVRRLPDLPGHAGAGGGGDGGGGGTLTDGVITLHPLTTDDAADTFRLRSLDDVVHARSLRAPDLDEVRLLCQRSESLWLGGIRADFVIRDTATGGYAGEIALCYHAPLLRQAQLGYSIVPAWRRRGYATRAVRLVSGWSFERTEIVGLQVDSPVADQGSQRVLEKAMFVRAGVHRLLRPDPAPTRIDGAVVPEVSRDRHSTV